jgi:hypothetical protein
MGEAGAGATSAIGVPGRTVITRCASRLVIIGICDGSYNAGRARAERRVCILRHREQAFGRHRQRDGSGLNLHLRQARPWLFRRQRHAAPPRTREQLRRQQQIAVRRVEIR